MKRAYKPACPVPVSVPEPAPVPPMDLVAHERKAFLRSVSPFHAHELDLKLRYIPAWCVSLIFGKPMPHEQRELRK